jgi:replicative DNA helicase
MLTEATPALTERTYSSLATQVDRVLQDYEYARFHPGMRGVTFGWPTADEFTLGAQGGDLIGIAGRSGLGKAQPVDSLVKVRGGWARIGDIKVGDFVMSQDGSYTRVTGVFPQGVKEVCKFTFRDNREVVCCKDHLWKVSNTNWKGNQEWRVLTSREIQHYLKASRNVKRMYVPLVNEYSSDDADVYLPIPPYLLGVILGDGGITKQVTISSADNHILDRVRSLLVPGYTLKYRSGYDYDIVKSTRLGGGKTNLYKLRLQKLGLMGLMSGEKFIPECYLNASYNQRLELLRGLMDTDGTVGVGKSVQYATVSSRLKDGIRSLIWSLGGVATRGFKQNAYKGCWIVGVIHSSPDMLFSLPRKRDKCIGVSNTDRRNRIDSVTDCGNAECVCISVEHPSSLYVTDNYVVTHNTWLMLEAVNAAHAAGYVPLVISMEMTLMQMAYRYIGRVTGINPKLIKQGELSDWSRQHLYQVAGGLRAEGEVPLYFMAGDMDKQVSSIEALMDDLEPDIVFIDGAYLLTGEAKKRGSAKWEDLGEVMSALKQLFVRKNRPCTMTVQLNRNVNKSTKRKLDTSDVGGSDRIPQDMSVLFGVKPGQAPYTRTRRVIDWVKNREDEARDFATKFQFNPVSFEEIALEEETDTDEDGNNLSNNRRSRNRDRQNPLDAPATVNTNWMI